MRPEAMDLERLEWRLEGWRQWDWKLINTIEASAVRRPDIGPMPARVPGSVRGALVSAGIVVDPYHGTQSRNSEFIENRHWIYRAVLPQDIPDGKSVLRFESLDGVGEAWLGSRRLGGFRNTHRAVSFAIESAQDLRGEELTLIFLTVPDELGQIGWTSKMRAWKPRFNYGWDWIPRIVQIGPAKAITLQTAVDPFIDSIVVSTEFVPGATYPLGSGSVTATVRWVCANAGASLRISVSNGAGDRLATLAHELPTADGELTTTVTDLNVESWWGTRSHGAPKLYSVVVELLEADSSVADRSKRRVGFRLLSWHSNPGAPSNAEPWLLHVDGVPTFVQGVNWVPLRPDYADVPDHMYRERLTTYRDLGVNMVRVWGGASLERNTFYDLCDELGLLIWQDLPLSSSGIDNAPPRDASFVEEFADIASDYALQLVHRPCLAMWCGGNELAGLAGEDPPGTPLDFEHPALSAAHDAIRRVDASRRILPASPSGPRYVAEEREFGQGLHHDVHGPWANAGSRDEWLRFWRSDDALFRSEVGIAGASDVSLLERYELIAASPSDDVFDVWRHSAAWWLDETDRPTSTDDIHNWVAGSQTRQAELMSDAASASKARFPRCGGFIVWMGHDTFPCPVSLAIIDFDGTVKPVGHALAKVFLNDAGSN